MNFHKRAEKANKERFKMVEKAEEQEQAEESEAERLAELKEIVGEHHEDLKKSNAKVVAFTRDGVKHERTDEGFTPKGTGQVDLEGEEARYPIEHEVSTTVTHKFTSAIAKVSISEKAYEKEQEKDRPDVVGLVKTKLRPAPSVEGRQWEALCAEFAAKVEEEM